MGDAAVGQGRAAGEVGDVFDVGGAHDARVVDGHVLKDAVEGHVLLAEGVEQIVVVAAGDGQDGLLVELGVIEAVEQVEAARAGGGEADAEAARELGVSAGGKCGGLFMAHLNELDAVLALAQGLHDGVDAIAGNAKDDVDAPGDEGVDQGFSTCGGHFVHSLTLQLSGVGCGL